MKYLRMLLLMVRGVVALAQFSSPFPTVAPSMGYSFVPAFTNIAWTGAYPPEQMMVHQGNLYVMSKISRVTLVTNTASTNRVIFLDNLKQAFYGTDSGFP